MYKSDVPFSLVQAGVGSPLEFENSLYKNPTPDPVAVSAESPGYYFAPVRNRVHTSNATKGCVVAATDPSVFMQAAVHSIHEMSVALDNLGRTFLSLRDQEQ